MEIEVDSGFGVTHPLREGFKKKGEKVWSFAIPGGRGRGSAKVVKMPYCFFGVLHRVKNGPKWLKNGKKTR